MDRIAENTKGRATGNQLFYLIIWSKGTIMTVYNNLT